MYPNLYYAFKDLFGREWTWLRFINSFGFFVALAFLAGAYVLMLELKRKEREGLMHGTEEKIVVGKPASIGELLVNFLLGFVLGYKIIGLFLSDSPLTADPPSFIVSSEGNWPAGIFLGLLFAGLKWWERNKQKLPKAEERMIRIWPHDRVGDIVIYAALFGFLGAKIFHNLENWDEFSKNPIDALLSFSGLTFYGGLICASLAIIYYARKHKIGIRHLADTMGPTLMLAYAIGRMGCQVSGDGDWGILNSAYVTSANSKSIPADSSAFKNALATNFNYYRSSFGASGINEVPHKTVEAPGWLPNWTVAYSYPNNVINEGVGINGCEGQYCSHLPVPVFPTPFYETLMCLVLFAFLWSIRKKLKVPGALFAVYLMVNGIERFLIEQIRVNTKYSIFGFHPTQAELISASLVITGLILYFWFQKKHKTQSS